MEIEKYSPKWLLNEIRDAESDAHALFKIIEFQKALTEQCNIANVVKSLPNDDEIEQAANDNADRIFGDDIGSNTEWYAMQHGFTDGVEWIKNHLAK